MDRARVSYPHDTPDAVGNSWPEFAESGRVSGNSFQNDAAKVDRAALQAVSRARFADLVRTAFPAPRKKKGDGRAGNNDAETARKCADWFDCDAKTVKNWLACTHSPPFDVVFGIGCKIGVYRVAEVMTRGQGRGTVLNMIVRGVRRVTGK